VSRQAAGSRAATPRNSRQLRHLDFILDLSVLALLDYLAGKRGGGYADGGL